jgi:hypothetical protein
MTLVVFAANRLWAAARHGIYAAINNERAADRRTGLVEKLAMSVAGIKLTVKERVA